MISNITLYNDKNGETEILLKTREGLVCSHLIYGTETEMFLMKPILAHTTLNHLHLLFDIWIRVRAIAYAV